MCYRLEGTSKGDKRKMTIDELKKEAYQFLIQATKEQRIMYFGGNLEELLADFAEPREKRIADLEKENAELKENYRKRGDTIISLERQLRLNIHSDNLTKAKEIIKKFSEFVNNGIEYDPEHPREHTDLWNKLCEEAKQFLNEVQ